MGQTTRSGFERASTRTTHERDYCAVVGFDILKFLEAHKVSTARAMTFLGFRNKSTFYRYARGADAPVPSTIYKALVAQFAPFEAEQLEANIRAEQRSKPYRVPAKAAREAARYDGLRPGRVVASSTDAGTEHPLTPEAAAPVPQFMPELRGRSRDALRDLARAARRDIAAPVRPPEPTTSPAPRLITLPPPPDASVTLQERRDGIGLTPHEADVLVGLVAKLQIERTALRAALDQAERRAAHADERTALAEKVAQDMTHSVESLRREAGDLREQVRTYEEQLNDLLSGPSVPPAAMTIVPSDVVTSRTMVQEAMPALHEKLGTRVDGLLRELAELPK
jgi:hypothetical protein